jgi:flavin-dependent dehydrogenase
MKSVKILGGGIAGLTAAITLKRAGIAVEVHERKGFCGKHTNDFQFIENWTFEEDALDILQRMYIQTDFYFKPWYSLEIISPSLKTYVGHSTKPLMYLIKRGNGEDSLDNSLEKQVIQQKVYLVKKSRLKINEADIVATGSKAPSFIASGIKFPFESPDQSIVLLDDNLSFKAYSYFIVNDNIGEIVSVNPVSRKDHLVRLGLTVERFEKILNFTITNILERFAASGILHFRENSKVNHQYFIGEAAGFQDCFFGFGMLYAFKSGYLAAKSIIENRDYQQLIKDEIIRPIKISAMNRNLFENLTNQGYERLIRVLCSRNPIIISLLGGKDVRQILKKFYNHSLSFCLRPLLFW